MHKSVIVLTVYLLTLCAKFEVAWDNSDYIQNCLLLYETLLIVYVSAGSSNNIW